MSQVLIFDFETTGPNPLEDIPVQVSLLGQGEKTGSQVIYMNALCNPGRGIPDGAYGVHGINDHQVAYMPFYTLQLWHLEQMVSTLMAQDPETYLAGHNISQYDVPMWQRCSQTCHILPPLIDTLDLLNRLYPEMPSKKLGDAYQSFFGERPQDLHNAMIDCMVSGRLLDHISEDKGMSLLEMAEWLQTPEPYEVMPFGKHQGVQMDIVPRSYLEWCMSNFDRIRPDFQATLDNIFH